MALTVLDIMDKDQNHIPLLQPRILQAPAQDCLQLLQSVLRIP